MRPERRVEKKFIDWCKTRNIRQTKLQALAENGFPDRTVWLPQVTLYIEFKAGPQSRLRPDQKRWVAWLRSQGHPVLVTHSFQEACTFVESFPRCTASAFMLKMFGE